MNKVLLIPLLFLIACIIAGMYGALHNQISYTVAPEYFTKFKFHQFQLLESFTTDRVKAAIVGWKASWWMGVLIGMVLIPLGLIIPGTHTYFMVMLRTFLTVAVTAFVVGLVALLVSFVLINPDKIGEFTLYGNEIVDDVAFARAGTMHNFSYLGGVLGIFTGGFIILKYWKKQRTKVE